MTGSAGPARGHVLVVTDADSAGLGALRLPFTRATILDATTDEPLADQRADTVVIDFTDLTPQRIADLVQRVRPILQPDGRLLVVLRVSPDFEAWPPATHDRPELSGWQWVGLETLDGIPSAVLRPVATTQEHPAVMELLRTAYTAALFATAHDARATRELARKGTQRQAAARRNSEIKLLGHIDSLIMDLDTARRPTSRALIALLLNRTALGRLVLRTLRLPDRLVARLRRRRVDSIHPQVRPSQ